MTTFAPSAASSFAVAAPTPRDEPVMTAVLPARALMGNSWDCEGLCGTRVVARPRRPRPGRAPCVTDLPSLPEHARRAARLGPRASGGIGRRAGFRFQGPRAWGFESPLAHASPPRRGECP